MLRGPPGLGDHSTRRRHDDCGGQHQTGVIPLFGPIASRPSSSFTPCGLSIGSPRGSRMLTTFSPSAASLRPMSVAACGVSSSGPVLLGTGAVGQVSFDACELCELYEAVITIRGDASICAGRWTATATSRISLSGAAMTRALQCTLRKGLAIEGVYRSD